MSPTCLRVRRHTVGAYTISAMHDIGGDASRHQATWLLGTERRAVWLLAPLLVSHGLIARRAPTPRPSRRARRLSYIPSRAPASNPQWRRCLPLVLRRLPDPTWLDLPTIACHSRARLFSASSTTPSSLGSESSLPLGWPFKCLLGATAPLGNRIGPPCLITRASTLSNAMHSAPRLWKASPVAWPALPGCRPINMADSLEPIDRLVFADDFPYARESSSPLSSIFESGILTSPQTYTLRPCEVVTNPSELSSHLDQRYSSSCLSAQYLTRTQVDIEPSTYLVQ